jgi:uncharacterized membrane protein
MRGWHLIVAAAFFEGTYALFQKLAGPLINAFLGAMIAEVTAGLVALIFIAGNGIGNLNYGVRGIVFAALIGVSAFGIDACALSAFDKGIKLSVGGPLIIAGGTALMILISCFIPGENISRRIVLGASVIIIGCLIMMEW